MRKEKKYSRNKQAITVLQMLPELEGGGVERGTLELGKYLANHGHRSLVVSAGGRLVHQLEREGSSHIAMKVGVKSPTSLKYILPLRNLMLREGVDVLHLRSRLPAWIGYLAWRSIPRNKRPVLITTFHGFYSINAYSAIMTKGEVVIAVSDSIKQHIAEHYGKDREVQLIFRGVDAETFNPDSIEPQRLDSLRESWNLTPGKPVIMLPGRITRLKGQDIFIKSLACLDRRDFEAVLVGDTLENAGYTNELRSIIKKNNLQDCVKLVGHCDDMAAALLLSDMVISATSNTPESFGRVAVEAMAMGKPVIATAHGGSLEIVEDKETGWLVQPADVVSMSRALDAALDMSKDELSRIGLKGQSRVMRKFTTQAMCDQTLSLYRKCLENR